MSVCQLCKQREATVHLTQIINGMKKDMLVCSQCAGSSGIKIDINSLITGLLDMQSKNREAERSTLICERCGMTAKEFNNTGKMGCANCYECFFEPMQMLLNRMHGKTHHMGKAPQKHESSEPVELQIEKLKDELAASIKTEAYERAAEIRDRIKELNNEKKGV